MILNEQQQDALTELVNIAFGKTAASLSELTGQRVLIDSPPRADLTTIDVLQDSLDDVLGPEIATVHQIFSGTIKGDAFLALDHDSALQLVDLLVDHYHPPQRMDASAREVLTEAGNILLNACLGVFGNLLQVHISFSVPRVHLEDLETLLGSLVIGTEEVRYALVISTHFRVRDSEVDGYLVIVLGVTSMDWLIRAVDDWRERQIGG